MRITKVKYDGAKVRIEYEKEREDGGYDEYSMTSLDKPAPTFVEALNALADDVVGICELPAEDRAKITVRGVTVTHTNDILGACITALKALKTANAPLVINTPHLPAEDYSGGEGLTLDIGTVDRLETLLLETEGFINGDRGEQPSLLSERAAEPVAAV